MNYKNLNPIFNSISDEQLLDVGSIEWNDGGALPYGGTTGSHPCYGFSHKHKLEKLGNEYARRVIANYFKRRIFYVSIDGFPVPRQISYEAGGRPLGWIPEDGCDLINGEAQYIVGEKLVGVSGPDPLHFHLSPLLALADSSGYEVIAQGKKVDASTLARLAIRFFMKSLAGQLVDKNGKVTSYAFGNRGSSCILSATVEAAKRGLIDPEDQKVLAEYITKTTLPFFTKIPGSMDFNPKPALINGKKNLQLYNGLYWIMPAMWDALKLAEMIGYPADAIQATINIWSQNMADLETINPTVGCQVGIITVPDNFAFEKPWKDQIAVEDFITEGSSDWSCWGMRAQRIAAQVTGSTDLAKTAASNLDKWKTKATSPNYKYTDADKAWMVGADGEYL